jgi:RimJ/RimL family protein N-acetyltransferase
MTMATDLAQWKACARPPRRVHEGNYTRLEPLDPARHGDALYAASSGADAERAWRFAADGPYPDRASFEPWLVKNAASEDPLMFAIIDKATGRAEGRQTFMRMTPEHGVIEVGYILFGSAIARTRVATEAIYLFAAHVFDDLGYRRFEWKCDNANEPSRRAAVRFGFTFEGIFRQHMVVKGHNRDTAWFSMLDHEWPTRKQAFRQWLAPDNFDAAGRQKVALSKLMAAQP